MREDDYRPKIRVRLLIPRGRIRDRFRVGRLAAGKGAERTSGAQTTEAASGRMIRTMVARDIGVWDSSGEQGRAELQNIIRRANR